MKSTKNQEEPVDSQTAKEARVRVNLNLTKANHDYVKAIAEDKRRTLTEQVNRIIDRDRKDHMEYYELVLRKREIEAREDI